MAAKGYDDSPTRNGTILFYSVLTVVVLIFIKFSLDSYFDKVFGGEVHDKILSRGMEPVKAMREKEAKALNQGAMPLSRAKQMMAQRGRAVSPVIQPASGVGEKGAGMEPVRGWSKLEREIPPLPPPPAVEAATADAGVGAPL